METHHLTLREMHRQELLIEATDARRVTHLTPKNPAETPRVQHQIMTLLAWMSTIVATLRSTPLTPQGIRHEVESFSCRLS